MLVSSKTHTEIGYLVLFCHLLLINYFKWFLKGSLCKNMESMLVFLKALYLVLKCPYYTLVTFLMILSVVLLSTLMILLATLSARNLYLASKLNLIYETWHWGRNCPDLSNGKSQLVSQFKSANSQNIVIQKISKCQWNYSACCSDWWTYRKQERVAAWVRPLYKTSIFAGFTPLGIQLGFGTTLLQVS